MVDGTTALESEADDTRDRIAATINGLQDRLSPTAVVHRTVDHITTSGSEAIASIRQSLSAHPAVFAIGGVAIGLAVLFHGRLSGDKPTKPWNGDEQHPLSFARPEAHEPRASAARHGEPLIGAVVSAIAGAAIAQFVPVSSTERKLLAEAGGNLRATVP